MDANGRAGRAAMSGDVDYFSGPMAVDQKQLPCAVSCDVSRDHHGM